MIAPEPFFEPRGTPFSEYFRIKALCHLGHEVDLITYPIGKDKDIKGLRIFRGLRPPFVKSVKTGPSAAKLFLDFFLFFKAWGRLCRGKYDVIHTHEEANIMGAFFSKISRVPHLYDMHSSLPQQLENFHFVLRVPHDVPKIDRALIPLVLAPKQSAKMTRRQFRVELESLPLQKMLA